MVPRDTCRCLPRWTKPYRGSDHRGGCPKKGLLSCPASMLLGHRTSRDGSLRVLLNIYGEKPIYACFNTMINSNISCTVVEWTLVDIIRNITSRKIPGRLYLVGWGRENNKSSTLDSPWASPCTNPSSANHIVLTISRAANTMEKRFHDRPSPYFFWGSLLKVLYTSPENGFSTN